MKMLMGAVIVLSMAAVTACGKKPEVADEKITPRIRGDIAVEGRDEKAYEVDQFMNSLENEIRGRVGKSSL